MKNLILIAFVCSALYSSAAGYFGIKPIVNEPVCFGTSSGSINLSVLGGTAPFQYDWSNGSTTASQTGLAAGTYSVTVTDANNLTTDYSIVIGQPYQIQVSSTVGVNGGNGSSIYLSVDGGTPGYTYSWNNGATTQDITGVPAGTYIVTVTDEVGCTARYSRTVAGPTGHFEMKLVSLPTETENTEQVLFHP